LSTTTEFSTLTTQGEVERLASSMLLDASEYLSQRLGFPR